MSDRYLGVGVRETEIWEIKAAITERTAAIAYVAGPHSYPSLEAVSRAARQHGVPVIVDAAGQLPPPANLRRFISEGADLVSFSGWKGNTGTPRHRYPCGQERPHRISGLAAARHGCNLRALESAADLIPKERLVGAPRHGVGRGYKVAKEQIVGLIVALQLFTEDRAQEDFERWLGLLTRLGDGLRELACVSTAVLTPKYQYGFPVLEIKVDENALGITAYDIAAELRGGEPPIYVGESKLMDGSVLIHPVNLNEKSTGAIIDRFSALIRGAAGHAE